MTLWAATRRLVPTAVVSAVVVVLVVLLGEVSASIPALASARGLALPLALIAPLAVSSVLGYALTTGDPILESVSVRPIAVLDTALVIATSGALFVLLIMVDAAGYAAFGAEAARNTLGFVGLLLIGRRVIGRNAATALPIVLVVLLAFFGADSAGEPRWWAWPLVDAGQRASWAAMLILISTGSLLELTRPARQRLYGFMRRLRPSSGPPHGGSG